MPTSVNEHMIITTDTSSGDIEVYLNAANEIFIQNTEEDARNFWFTLNEEDWNSLKNFIDDIYKRLKRTQ